MSRRGILIVAAAVLWTAAFGAGIYQATVTGNLGILGGTMIGGACMITGWLLADELIDRAVERAIRTVRDTNEHMLDGVAARLAAAVEGDEEYRPPLRSL